MQIPFFLEMKVAQTISDCEISLFDFQGTIHM
jgi:hypothetical protein